MAIITITPNTLIQTNSIQSIQMSLIFYFKYIICKSVHNILYITQLVEKQEVILILYITQVLYFRALRSVNSSYVHILYIISKSCILQNFVKIKL